jgi:TolB-like protein/Flp pilus assembly protein TadD
VIVVYATAAFVILEAVDIIFPRLNFPDWTVTFVMILLAVGFPIALIFSWIFDVTPEGIEKTRPVKELPKGEKTLAPNSWRIVTFVSVVIIIGLIAFNIFGGKRGVRIDESLSKSIAVLPFENMSDGIEYSYLGDAMTDEIIMQLYKIQDFEIRSRTSIMQYKNTLKGSPVIGQELNVNYLLEGSAQRYGDKVRIRVQLIQAETDNHIWAEVFEGDWDHIYEIQINMAKQVARELKTILSPEEIKRIESTSTDSIDAYTLYLKGRFSYNHESGKKALDESIKFYNEALSIDPEFALAYAGKATSLTSYATWGYAPRKDVMYQSKIAAIKALELDNTLGEAHAALAWARVIHDWDWNEGEEEIKYAIRLNPNNADAYSRYAWILAMLNRCDEAIQANQRALELDPLSEDTWAELGRMYYFARKYDKAIEEFRKVLEVYPDSDYTRIHLALALSLNGMHDQAIEEGSYVDIQSSWYWYLGYIYGIAGLKEKALNVLDHYHDLANTRFVWLSNFAFIYVGIGEKDKAFEILDKIYEQREAWLDLLQVEPMYDNLRSDPRFRDLLEKMRFPN